MAKWDDFIQPCIDWHCCARPEYTHGALLIAHSAILHHNGACCDRRALLVGPQLACNQDSSVYTSNKALERQ